MVGIFAKLLLLSTTSELSKFVTSSWGNQSLRGSHIACRQKRNGKVLWILSSLV